MERRRRAIVFGASGKQHRVFLIRGARVVREKDTDAYLKYGWNEPTGLGHWEGKFHFQ